MLLLALGLAGVATTAQDEPAIAAPEKPYKLGVRVPPLRLPDLDGKETTVVDEDTENVTAIVFWSLRDPIAQRYLPKLEELRQDFAEQGVQLFLIDSNRDEITSAATDPLEKLRKFTRDKNVRIPILVDMKNVIADDFGAVSANHVFVLGSTRRLVYHGAIDDDPRGKREEEGRDVRPFLRDALAATLLGEKPPETWTRPTGRPIKRWPSSTEKGK
jgi:peroxiredoxin